MTHIIPWAISTALAVAASGVLLHMDPNPRGLYDYVAFSAVLLTFASALAWKAIGLCTANGHLWPIMGIMGIGLLLSGPFHKDPVGAMMIMAGMALDGYCFLLSRPRASS